MADHVIIKSENIHYVWKIGGETHKLQYRKNFVPIETIKIINKHKYNTSYSRVS